MSLVGKTNGEKVWNYFKAKGLSDCGIAGLLGNLYAESGLNPHNLQNTGNKKLNMTDDEYTLAVDKGSYSKDKFIKDSFGFGLCQWTYWSRKQALYEFAKAHNKSIGDLKLQLDFLYKELQESYPSILKELKLAASVLEASNVVLFQFERPADQGKSVQSVRASYGQKYYNEFAKEDIYMTEVKKDSTPDAWAKEAVEWAVDNKILFGDEHGDYKLHSNCTRQEMLIFLNRLYKLVK